MKYVKHVAHEYSYMYYICVHMDMYVHWIIMRVMCCSVK